MPRTNRFPLKRLLLGIGGLALAAVAVVAATSDSDAVALSSVELSAAPKVGEPAPAFTAVDTRGGSHSLADYRGRWVVLEWVNHECPYTKKHYTPVDGGAGNTQVCSATTRSASCGSRSSPRRRASRASRRRRRRAS